LPCRENVNDIAFAQDKIDEFKTREANSSIRGKTVDEARRALEGRKERFLSLAEQPEWLKGGGKLRDYQLEGLNRLIYR
jgi:chromodomain-helicase-DNA-binding protein 1